jgi:hypothetical protein
VLAAAAGSTSKNIDTSKVTAMPSMTNPYKNASRFTSHLSKTNNSAVIGTNVYLVSASAVILLSITHRTRRT